MNSVLMEHSCLDTQIIGIGNKCEFEIKTIQYARDSIYSALDDMFYFYEGNPYAYSMYKP